MARLPLGFLALILLLVVGVRPSRAAGPLDVRAASWPEWRLPAPLQRPGRAEAVYPDWVAGAWRSCDAPEPGGAGNGMAACFEVRFRRDTDGQVVADRAGNTLAAGRAQLGDRLRWVRDDPENADRQVALLADGTTVASRVLGRRSDRDAEGAFLIDELTLQIVRSPAGTRISRVEVLNRLQRLTPGPGDGKAGGASIVGERWQATYPSPSQGLRVAASRTEHGRFTMTPLTSEPRRDPG
jgi:hypothetical protein